MKKTYSLLIIAESFANSFTVASTRITNYVKYLPKDEWEIHVISAKNINLPERTQKEKHFIENNLAGFEEVDYDLSIPKLPDDNWIKKINRLFYVEKSRPVGLYDRMWERIEAYLQNHSIDILLATTSDLYTLALANKASKIFNISWVADLRDIWEQHIEKIPFSREKLYVLRSIARRNHILKTASEIVVASDQIDILKRKTGKSNIIQIRNGYDPEIFRISKDKQPVKTNVFRILYTGKLGAVSHRVLRDFFMALKEIIEEGIIDRKEISVDFYATEESILSPYILPELEDTVNMTEYMPLKEIVEKIYPSVSVFLLLSHTSSINIVPTKFYEYSTARKPILCINENQEIRNHLKNLENGDICTDKEQIKNFLINYISEFKERGSIDIDVSEEKIKPFSRREQTFQLAGILKKTIEQNENTSNS